ncbi:MAG TPA: helix-turn-helix domain-containing protein, partial [Actinomycetaceae bacterium]|nr:helix-turn-helix domain-containing protein [Actinomycetaceae bacterium]
MSLKAMLWVFDDLADLSQAETLVMLALADFADEDGTCWPSQATLARRARVGVRTLRTHVKRLEELGLLGRARRGGGGRGRQSDVYVLRVGARLPAQGGAEAGAGPGGVKSQVTGQPAISCRATGNLLPVATYIQTPK